LMGHHPDGISGVGELVMDCPDGRTALREGEEKGKRRAEADPSCGRTTS